MATPPSTTKSSYAFTASTSSNLMMTKGSDVSPYAYVSIIICSSNQNNKCLILHRFRLSHHHHFHQIGHTQKKDTYMLIIFIMEGEKARFPKERLPRMLHRLLGVRSKLMAFSVRVCFSVLSRWIFSIKINIPQA
jgi:hypothetical protein